MHFGCNARTDLIIEHAGELWSFASDRTGKGPEAFDVSEGFGKNYLPFEPVAAMVKSVSKLLRVSKEVAASKILEVLGFLGLDYDGVLAMSEMEISVLKLSVVEAQKTDDTRELVQKRTFNAKLGKRIVKLDPETVASELPHPSQELCVQWLHDICTRCLRLELEGAVQLNELFEEHLAVQLQAAAEAGLDNHHAIEEMIRKIWHNIITL